MIADIISQSASPVIQQHETYLQKIKNNQVGAVMCPNTQLSGENKPIMNNEYYCISPKGQERKQIEGQPVR